MKYMFIIPRMGGGGAERVIANISNKLVKEGHEVSILTIVSKDSFYELDKSIKIYSAECDIQRKNIFEKYLSYSKNFFKSFKFILKTIKIIQPNYVISFLVETDILTYIVHKIDKNWLHICSERNDPTRRSHLLKFVLKQIYKQVDLFICQSEMVSNYYAGIEEHKKIVIPNPIDFNLIPEPVEESNIPEIVSVGRLFEQKNFGLLIESFVIAYPFLDSRTMLTIYGDGPLRDEYEQKIRLAKLDNNIILKGASTDVIEQIKTASLFIMTSDYEGYPNALVEAMAVGIPVISTDFATGVAKDLISDKNGLIIEVNNQNQLVEAMINLMTDKNKRQKLRNQNSDFKNVLASDKIVQKWINAIELIDINKGV